MNDKQGIQELDKTTENAPILSAIFAAPFPEQIAGGYLSGKTPPDTLSPFRYDLAQIQAEQKTEERCLASFNIF